MGVVLGVEVAAAAAAAGGPIVEVGMMGMVYVSVPIHPHTYAHLHDTTTRVFRFHIYTHLKCTRQKRTHQTIYVHTFIEQKDKERTR